MATGVHAFACGCMHSNPRGLERMQPHANACAQVVAISGTMGESRSYLLTCVRTYVRTYSLPFLDCSHGTFPSRTASSPWQSSVGDGSGPFSTTKGYPLVAEKYNSRPPGDGKCSISAGKGLPLVVEMEHFLNSIKLPQGVGMHATACKRMYANCSE